MKLLSIPLVAVATGVALVGTAQAQNSPAQRGYQYFAPGRSFGQNTPANNNLQQSTSALPGAAAAPGQVAPTPRHPAPTAPGSWGVRYAAGYGYPASLFGQFVQNPGYQSPSFSTAQTYSSPEVAQGTVPVPATPHAPVYVNPQPGTSQPAPGYGAPLGGGISSIYAYSGRYPGAYYGYGPQYYGYGGSCGWGSSYNSPYYNSGCYSANACCRAPRRLCTPFGGMAYGCGSGCYVVTPPTCPTTCDPSGAPAVGPGVAPPTYSPGAQPQPMPPTPQPLDTPAPPQPLVKPAPQASNSPPVPIFPRIPNLPDA
jgi:hypothetical protein